MARKPMMAGNWKMNNAIGEAVVLTQEISNNWWKDWEDKVDVVICPPFVDLKPVKTVLEFDKTKIFVGAQNVYWEEAGAFTGEVSVPMIRECGCDYCIVGHSERRGLFGETNEDVNKKVRALLGGRLAPIVCVAVQVWNSCRVKRFPASRRCVKLAVCKEGEATRRAWRAFVSPFFFAERTSHGKKTHDGRQLEDEQRHR